jgi:phosphatidylglycerol lysyltransferase
MVVMVTPALGWLLTQQVLPGGAVAAFLVLSVLFCLLVWALFNFIRRGATYRFCRRYTPGMTARLDELDWMRFQPRYLLYAVLLSCLVELVGIAHIFIAVRTLGGTASVSMAFAGYMAVLIVLMTSPFLRGVGAVEALLVYVLMHFGLPALESVSAAMLFRFFEFWLMLLFAAPVFLIRPGSLIIRLMPAFLLFSLGAVNIISTLTPGLAERMSALRDFIPLSAIHASSVLTAVTGVVMLGTAFYLMRGLKSAWWLAAGLSAVSLVTHLVKGLDYEEASLALITLGALIYQRSDYRIRTDFALMKRAWVPALIMVAAVWLLSGAGFYLLDHRHFGAEFTWEESSTYALQTFLMIRPESLHPMTAFGAQFLDILYATGACTIVLAVYTAFRPLLPKFENEASARERAMELVRRYGDSPMDYFKTYRDKKFFFNTAGNAFVAYKSTPSYALALENPVCPDEATQRASVIEFDLFCRGNGLRSMYYRIPETSAEMYRSLHKKLLPLGQEAVVDLSSFNLDGKERKSLRNAVNKMEREDYRFVVHEAPHDDRLLQQLRAVSDAWLRMLQRTELNFSQGTFDEQELKNQCVLTLENAEGKVFTFINLIPGRTPEEANFDLMRRTEDAPPGTMDFMFVKMFFYLQSKGYKTCNLGMVPMSGLDRSGSLPENVLKIAYERLPRFSVYKSLRQFKDKFDPVWETTYVAFDSQLDMMNLPLALREVVRAS